MFRWYVLHVQTGRELDIKHSIEKRIGIDAVVPREEMQIRKSGKWHIETRVLFVGYVFIICEWSAELWHRLKKIDGVIKILNCPLAPIPLKDSEVNDLQMLAPNDLPIKSSSIYKDGEVIEVIAGALQHFKGNIIKINPRQKRAVISINMFGGERQLTLPINLIKKSE